jgi:hypothetical protein
MNVNEGVLDRLTKLVQGLELEEEDLVTEIIVVVKKSNSVSGRVGLCYNHDTKDWIIRRGMLDAVLEIETSNELVQGDSKDEED